MASNPDVYPVTAALEKKLAAALTETRFSNVYHFNKLVDMATEVVGEYEHGTASIEETGVTLQKYADVVEDLIVYMINAQVE